MENKWCMLSMLEGCQPIGKLVIGWGVQMSHGTIGLYRQSVVATASTTILVPQSSRTWIAARATKTAVTLTRTIRLAKEMPRADHIPSGEQQRRPNATWHGCVLCPLEGLNVIVAADLVTGVQWRPLPRHRVQRRGRRHGRCSLHMGLRMISSHAILIKHSMTLT